MRRFACLVAILCYAIAVALASPVQRLRSAAAQSTEAPLVHRNQTSHRHGAVDSCSFNGFSGQCVSKETCSGTVIPDQCPGSSDNECCIKQAEPAPGCGTAAVARALTWVNMQLLYCQSPNGQRDYDADCSEYCHRAVNPKWDAYRSDCSGLVSYAYGLPAPGRDTDEFPPYTSDIGEKISPYDLQPGDAINSTPHEHIMIFKRWTNAENTTAELIEEPGCSSDIPYARITETAVTISDDLIHVESNNMTFFAIRFFTDKNVC